MLGADDYAQWARDYEAAHVHMGEHPNVTIAAIRGGAPWRLSPGAPARRMAPSDTSSSATTSLPEVRKTCPTRSIWMAPARAAGFSGVTFANGCIAFLPT